MHIFTNMKEVIPFIYFSI